MYAHIARTGSERDPLKLCNSGPHCELLHDLETFKSRSNLIINNEWRYSELTEYRLTMMVVTMRVLLTGRTLF